MAGERKAIPLPPQRNED
jgi:hypothetical protein